MADLVPLVVFPPGQSPALAGAIAALLCTVLGAVQVINGTVTAVGDEATAVEAVHAATVMLQTGAATGLERARWHATTTTRAASSA